MKDIALLIVKHLRDQVQLGKLTPDATEGVEVAIQCLQEAFKVSEEELQASKESLQDLYCRHKLQCGPKVVTNEQRVEAENLKQVGNTLMNEKKFKEAITNYTRAIEIDQNNAVYYCNRAAAHIKLGAFGTAIEDCLQAIRIDPRYSKAHSRLGFAYSAIENHVQAKACYEKALELEPGNESYQTCLKDIEAHLARSRSGPFSEVADLLPLVDLPGLLQNPRFVNMMSDPSVQRLVEGVFGQQGISPLGNVQDLISLGQQITERLQQGAAGNATSGQGERPNGFPDLIRPQDGDAAPASQAQSVDPQQLEARPDLVQQTVEDHPPGINLPGNRNLGSLDLAPPSCTPRGNAPNQGNI